MKKIICIGIISMFLLTSFITVSAVDVKIVGNKLMTIGYEVYNNAKVNIPAKIEFITVSSVDSKLLVKESGGSINDAVDNYDLTFTNTNRVHWDYQEERYWWDNDAAKTGSIPEIDETCMLETNVEGSSKKILRYAIAVDSSDILGLYYDGELTWWIMGPPPYDNLWAIFTVEIPGGSHRLGWGFTNMGGNGYGFLDQIQLRDLSYNNPPNTPYAPYQIWDKTKGWTGIEYEFTVGVSNDPDGDEMYLLVDWGDGTNSGWIGPQPNGMCFGVSHTWTSSGTYEIKCKAKDDPNPFVEDGIESGWSAPWTLKIRGIKSSNNVFIPKFFERFLKIFPILN